MATIVPRVGVPGSPTIETPDPVDLPLARRLQALGFRSWPAATTTFDGTWAIRLTAGAASKRQNSVNPLDPGDTARLDERIDAAEARFRSFGRTPTFSISPLAPPALDERLAARSWARRDESIVMLAPLDTMDLRAGLDMVPLADAGRWLDAEVALGAFSNTDRPGIAETLAAIRPHAQGALPVGTRDGPVQLYVAEDDSGAPLAALLAVRFGLLVGLFQIVVDPARRREGHARRLIASALTNAAREGAVQAWLQVERSNVAAVALYESLGLRTAYGYHYRQPAE